MLHLWASLPTLVPMFYIVLPQLAKHSETFLLFLNLVSAFEKAPFEGLFGELDDHYPSSCQRNGIADLIGGWGQIVGLRGNWDWSEAKMWTQLPAAPKGYQ